MRPLSIKANVTIWYTGLLVAILVFVMAFVLNLSDNLMLSKANRNLMETVITNTEKIDRVNGTVDLSHLEWFDNGANIIVHSSNGSLLFGQYPNGFPERFNWTNDTIKTVSASGKKWIVYDHIVKSLEYDDFIVRGIASVDIVAQTINIATIIALILFPMLIMLSAFGGYRITKKAFRPVKMLAETANEISSGDDLSRRIGLSDTRESVDEIHSLAFTIDEMLDRLQKSFERERQFTSDASHELRTPTSVIMAQSEFALSNIDNPDDVKESLKIILSQSQKMSDLISQLLMFSRINKIGNPLDVEEIDFSELAEIVASEMMLTAKSSEIDLTTDIQKGLKVKVDQLLMTRLLMNLLSNGIKYGEKGGFVKLSVSKVKRQLVCQVSDNGIGIAKEDLDKIWDRFYQVNPARTAGNTESMGFGLSMAKWIVEAHQGKLTVQSEFGKGSTFTFKIPIE